MRFLGRVTLEKSKLGIRVLVPDLNKDVSGKMAIYVWLNYRSEN